MLVRDFIHDSLYAADGGYFVKRDVIYAPPAFIDFNNLLGQFEYRQVLAKLYAAQEHAWLTPALVFQPWYSYAIARWLIRQVMTLRAKGGKHVAAPLIVYEVGGGTGTNAKHICDYVKANAPQLYRAMRYTILEISPSLHERQTTLLAPHAAVARSVVADATNLAAAGVADERPCLVVACEVLDNLPHDKVVQLATAPALDSKKATPGPLDATDGLASPSHSAATVSTSPSSSSTIDSLRAQGWHEVTVQPLPSAALGDGREAFRELIRPLADPVICQTMPFVLGNTPGSGQDAARQPSLADKARSLLRSLLGSIRNIGGGAAGMPHDGAPLPPGVTSARYVPTGSLQLLRSLQAAFPRHGLWMADFDSLPPPATDFTRAAREDNLITLGGNAPGQTVTDGVEGSNPASTGAGGVATPAYYPAPICAPLVASKGGAKRRTIDHPTYLSPRRGTADIFFPTDFAILAAMTRHVRAEAGHSPLQRAQPLGSAAAIANTAGLVTGKLAARTSLRKAHATASEAALAASKSPSARAQAKGNASATATADETEGSAQEGGDADAEGAAGVRVLTSAQFLASFADVRRTATLSGYNPLLEDYVNTRVLTADLPQLA